MKTRKRVKKKRRIGRRPFLLLLLPALTAYTAGKKKSPDLYAIIGGTVFRDPGFAFRGAEIVLEPEKQVVAGVKLKSQKAVSDTRGEFAFRVPPVEAKYTLKASAQGMKGETKTAITRGGEERIDVTFTLLPASKE
jgi:hypothetical protein